MQGIGGVVMEAVTIPRVCIPSVSIGGIYLPGIGVPDGGKKGLIWPKGLKESIKAIYDPASQGMTNYDVIESYAEDFSKLPWNNKKEKYTGTLTPNTLTITNVAVTSALIYTNSKPENFKVYITGIKDNQQVIFGDDTSTYRALIVEKDGVYDVNWEDNHHAYCIWCNFLGDCNITITQLPTSILKDLSGNGNHAYLYGGKGKLNSGIGLYTYDYNSDRWSSTGRADYIITKKGFEFTNIIEDGGIIFALGSNIAKEGDKVKVKISGIPNGGRVYFGTWITATEDGEYLGTYAYDNNGNTTIGTLGCIGATITLEFIPDYPNQLCYDGKMYAVCYGFPILEDYTVMADRTWFDKEEYSAFVSNSLGGMEDPSNGAFSVEVKSLDSFTVMSFGSLTSISTPEKGITYQTKQSYNGISINVGIRESNDVLTLGGRYYYKNDNNAGNLWNGCHGKIIIADRSFTEDEITWLKDSWKKI